jgi:hypothetical protein
MPHVVHCDPQGEKNVLIRSLSAGSSSGSAESPIRVFQVGEMERETRMSECTLVISVVSVSISLSSAVRSEKPGKTCLAWSFSNDVTVE